MAAVNAALPSVPPTPMFNELPSVPAKRVSELLTVSVLLSVPASVRVLSTVNVLLLTIVNVAVAAGCVRVNLFTLVAVAALRVGEVNVGEAIVGVFFQVFGSIFSGLFGCIADREGPEILLIVPRLPSGAGVLLAKGGN